MEPLADTPERAEIRDAVRAICDRFDDQYWAEKDRTHSFPFEFAKAIADGGWLGIAMPEEYGGAGLGVTEAAIMMQVVGGSAGAFAACSTVHINIFGLHPIVKHGTDKQRKDWLPSIIDGSSRACFGVTEPDAGLDTSKIKTRAVRKGDRYIVHGQKIWTSTAQQADKIVLLARTTPIEECAKPADGLSLFYADLDRSKIEIREILKMGRHAVNSNQVFFYGLRFRSSIASARKEEASAIFSTASIRSASSTRLKLLEWAGALWKRPSNTPMSGWCLAGPSARTKRSSIRWRSAGPSFMRRN